MKQFYSWIITSLSLGLLLRFYLDLRSLVTVLELEKAKLNITSSLRSDIVLFNRVPKVGSQTLWKIIDNLAYINHFNSTSDSYKLKAIRGAENVHMVTGEQESYVDMWTNDISKPFIYNKHFFFINFEDFGQRNPIYINMVRHPVERVISWYYYIRNPMYQFIFDDESLYFKTMKTTISIGRLKRSLDDCIAAHGPECTYTDGQIILGTKMGGSHFSQIAFFCGMHPECHVFQSVKAYNRAVENVNKYFPVIGVSEEFDKSLRVFEAYIPKYFKDTNKVYRKGFYNKNNFKPKVSNEVWNQLANNFTLEIKFYEYCKERLNKQYLSISSLST